MSAQLLADGLERIYTLEINSEEYEREIVRFSILHHSALLQALRAQGWQPIAEAPKDGRDILIVNDGFGHPVRVGFWDSARGGKWSIWPGREEADPTHWQLLPAPPTERAK